MGWLVGPVVLVELAVHPVDGVVAGYASSGIAKLAGAGEMSRAVSARISINWSPAIRLNRRRRRVRAYREISGVSTGCACLVLHGDASRPYRVFKSRSIPVGRDTA